MNSCGVLNLCLFSDIISSCDKYATLESFVDTIECMTTTSTLIVYTDDIFFQECNGLEFANWIYDYQSQPDLRDLKKELSIQIEKATSIDEEEYNRCIHSVNTLNVTNGLVMSICDNESTVLYVGTTSRLWEALQWHLANHVKKSEFVSEAKNCFPNLYFHPKVYQSFNTLNGDYFTERPIIVAHLHALDAFKERFMELMSNSIGYREICEEFEATSGIECSPQASRTATRNLHYEFTNSHTKISEKLLCEMHTKLKWHGMDRVHQDRIYFHPGKAGIEGNKVLIAHIGTHM